MSVVPEGWRSATLSEVARWGSGGTPTAGNARFYGGDIPWAVIGDLNDGVVNTTAKTITEDGLNSSAAKWVPRGAVLVAMYGSIGKLGMVGTSMTTNQAIAFAVPGPDLDSKFLFYYLMSQRSLLDTQGKGATQRNISQAILKPWPIPMPDLAEQRRIVEILEDHLSHLAVGDDGLSRAGARLGALFESVLNEHVPEGIETRPLGELLDVPLSNGRSVPSRDGGFPVLRLTALRDSGVDLAERKEGAWDRNGALPFLVSRGDFLIARGNGTLRLVGRGSLVREEPDEVAFPDTAIRAQPRASDLLPEPGSAETIGRLSGS